MTAVSPAPESLTGSRRRHTRRLDEPSDVALVGGKASALGRAARAGVRVPPGFVLTVAAAEAAIGLAILVIFFRRRGSIAVDDVNRMHG